MMVIRVLSAGMGMLFSLLSMLTETSIARYLPSDLFKLPAVLFFAPLTNFSMQAVPAAYVALIHTIELDIEPKPTGHAELARVEHVIQPTPPAPAAPTEEVEPDDEPTPPASVEYAKLDIEPTSQARVAPIEDVEPTFYNSLSLIPPSAHALSVYRPFQMPSVTPTEKIAAVSAPTRTPYEVVVVFTSAPKASTSQQPTPSPELTPEPEFEPEYELVNETETALEYEHEFERVPEPAPDSESEPKGERRSLYEDAILWMLMMSAKRALWGVWLVGLCHRVLLLPALSLDLVFPDAPSAMYSTTTDIESKSETPSEDLVATLCINTVLATSKQTFAIADTPVPSKVDRVDVLTDIVLPANEPVSAALVTVAQESPSIVTTISTEASTAENVELEPQSEQPSPATAGVPEEEHKQDVLETTICGELSSIPTSPRHLPAADIGATQDGTILIPKIIITEPPSVEVSQLEEHLETAETTPIPESPLDVPNIISDPILEYAAASFGATPEHPIPVINVTTFEDTEVPPTITVSLLSLEETRAASLCAIESAETVSTKEHDSLPAVSVEELLVVTNDTSDEDPATTLSTLTPDASESLVDDGASQLSNTETPAALSCAIELPTSAETRDDVFSTLLEDLAAATGESLDEPTIFGNSSESPEYSLPEPIETVIPIDETPDASVGPYRVNLPTIRTHAGFTPVAFKANPAGKCSETTPGSVWTLDDLRRHVASSTPLQQSQANGLSGSIWATPRCPSSTSTPATPSTPTTPCTLATTREATEDTGESSAVPIVNIPGAITSRCESSNFSFKDESRPFPFYHTRGRRAGKRPSYYRSGH